MRKKLIPLMLILLGVMVSCGGGSSEKGAENVDSKGDANQIIAYTNDVIDYLNGSGSWIRSNDDRIDALVTGMETKKTPRILIPMIPDVSFNLKSGKLNILTPPSVMSQEEQTYFKDKMTAYKAAYTSLTSQCGILYKYIQNQDYRDDNYEKGKMLADSIKINYEFVNTTKKELYSKIDVVTEKAENIILADSPIREPIIAMKEEMKHIESLYDMFSLYTEKGATPAQVDSAYQAAAASVEKNKGNFQKILEDNKVKSEYDRFYKNCDEALSAYRKVLRDVKENKKVRESEFNTFSSRYNSLVNSYNSFVK